MLADYVKKTSVERRRRRRRRERHEKGTTWASQLAGYSWVPAHTIIDKIELRAAEHRDNVRPILWPDAFCPKLVIEADSTGILAEIFSICDTCTQTQIILYVKENRYKRKYLKLNVIKDLMRKISKSKDVYKE